MPSKVAAMRLLGIGPAGVCLLSRWPDYEIDRYLVRNQDGLLAAGYQGADIRERVRQCRKLGCFVTRSVLTPGYTAVVIDFEVDGVVYGVSAASAGSEGGKQFHAIREALDRARASLATQAIPEFALHG
ncbi:DNA-binding protein [Bordetella pertussis]|nr:DNA-binding protein [Bordetella pertussis]